MKISLSIIVAIFATIMIVSSCSKSTPVAPTPTSMWLVLSEDTTASAPASDGIVSATMRVRNVSNKDKRFLFRYSYGAEATFGHIAQLCIGDLCLDLASYDPTLQLPFEILAGAEDYAKVQVVTNGTFGVTTVRVVLYDVDNPSDTLEYFPRLEATF